MLCFREMWEIYRSKKQNCNAYPICAGQEAVAVEATFDRTLLCDTFKPVFPTLFATDIPNLVYKYVKFIPNIL